MEYRSEHDSMGEVLVPADALWGAQTQRSHENFPIGTERMPIAIIRAFAVLKKAAALANASLGRMDEKDAALIAGAAGTALCLGADFVKVNPPSPTDDATSAELLKVASLASGRCGLVCAGGSTVDARTFLSQLYDQIHIGGACGNATGRNIHQRSLDEAVRLTKAISAITFADYDVDEAMDVFEGKENFSL